MSSPCPESSQMLEPYIESLPCSGHRQYVCCVCDTERDTAVFIFFSELLMKAVKKSLLIIMERPHRLMSLCFWLKDKCLLFSKNSFLILFIYKVCHQCPEN